MKYPCFLEHKQKQQKLPRCCILLLLRILAGFNKIMWIYLLFVLLVVVVVVVLNIDVVACADALNPLIATHLSLN